MTIIRMETEKVHALAKKMDTDGSQMLSMLGEIRSSSSRLRLAWQGSSAAEFNNDLDTLIKKIENQVVALQTLSVRVSCEVDEWLANDRFEIGSSRDGTTLLQIATPDSQQLNWLSPAGVEETLLAGGGFSLLDGIHSLYGVAKDQFNRLIDLGKRQAERAVHTSDQFVDDRLTNLLGDPQSQESESVTLKVKGGVSFPGAELGIPGTLRGETVQQVTITKKDGKYILTLSNTDGAGLEEPLVVGKGGIKIGGQEKGEGIDIAAQVLAKQQVQTTYTFDPKNLSDLTQMGALLVSMGVLNPRVGPLVGPSLPALRDNLTSIQVGKGIEGNAKVDISKLLKIQNIDPNIDINAQGMLEGELRRAADGRTWELVQRGEFELGGSTALLDSLLNQSRSGSPLKGKIEGQVKLISENVINLSDHHRFDQSVKVVVDLKSEAGFELEDLKGLAPALKGLKYTGNKYGSVQAEFTVDGPVELVKDMIESPKGGINWLIDNSTVIIRGNTGVQLLALSGEAQLAEPTQKLGLSAEVNVTRESTREIWRYEGKDFGK